MFSAAVLKQEIASKDIECKPELSYFFAFEEQGQTLLTTNSTSVAQEACQNGSGQLTTDSYYSRDVLQECYNTLLETAKVFDPSISHIRNFGREDAASVETTSIVVCQSKFTQVRLAEVFKASSFCCCKAS